MAETCPHTGEPCVIDENFGLIGDVEENRIAKFNFSTVKSAIHNLREVSGCDGGPSQTVAEIEGKRTLIRRCNHRKVEAINRTFYAMAQLTSLEVIPDKITERVIVKEN